MSASDERVVVYLRGVPKGLVREAKAAAARSDRSLAALVADALQTYLRGAARTPSPARRRDLERVRAGEAWYRAHRDEAVRRYAGEYAAITGEGVIDHDADYAQLSQRVFAKLGYVSISMPKVSPDERTVRLRSPRFRR